MRDTLQKLAKKFKTKKITKATKISDRDKNLQNNSEIISNLIKD